MGNRKAKNVFADVVDDRESFRAAMSTLFDYIDHKSLAEDLETYLLEANRDFFYDCGYNDGVDRSKHDEQFKKYEPVFKIYHEGYLAGWRGE